VISLKDSETTHVENLWVTRQIGCETRGPLREYHAEARRVIVYWDRLERLASMPPTFVKRPCCVGKPEALLIQVFFLGLCPYESEVDLAPRIDVASLDNRARGDRCALQLILVIGLE
jgi:hypothetical protein